MGVPFGRGRDCIWVHLRDAGLWWATTGVTTSRGLIDDAMRLVGQLRYTDAPRRRTEVLDEHQSRWIWRRCWGVPLRLTTTSGERGRVDSLACKFIMSVGFNFVKLTRIQSCNGHHDLHNWTCGRIATVKGQSPQLRRLGKTRKGRSAI